MKTNKPFPDKANYVIIGGGISGVSVAWHLAKKGAKDIVVLESEYLSYGATGRCGAGIRQQWSTKANVLLAKKSIEFFENAQDLLDYDDDIEFKQEGYLIVGTDEEEDRAFKENVKLQQSLGVPAEFLTPKEAKEIVPHLNLDGVTSATYCKTDGHLNPFKMTDAFYKAAKRLGVSFFTHTKVNDITVKNGKIESVQTTKGTIEADVVINAAGGFAQDIGEMAGVEIPVKSQNREILVTEPIEKIQGPMVISFSRNIYCQQTPHGAFIMGRGDDRDFSQSMHSTHQFLEAMAKTATRLLPPIGQLRVIRQWAGLYNFSPDSQPIISGSKDVEGFYMACGFSGHGFMLAPMTGQIIREMVLGEPSSVDTESLSLARFEKGAAKTMEQNVV